MWSTFLCDNPDFIVRSIRDGAQYGVQRSCLTGSEVFRDMFACCDMGYVTDLSSNSDSDQILDLDEPADLLVILLHVLHFPPPPPTVLPYDKEGESYETEIRTRSHLPSSVIPLPLLPQLFHLADKYIISKEITQSLRCHLQAHGPMHPLQVYGFATERAWHSIAAEASKFLLHPPLSAYTMEDVKAIPTVEAYHSLVLLHAFRVKRLRETLLAEEIFPHGYGACPIHRRQTSDIWERKRNSLALRIEAATDVAAEMAANVSEALQHCKMCNKACTAAIDMLAYKCRRIPRRVDKLQAEFKRMGIDDF